MPRNNQDRLGIQNPGNDPHLEETKNPILNFVIPTEFVDLPSKGKFYPSDHPLHDVETVEIKYMTAKDTDILTSASLLKKGVAIDRMLENVLVDKNIKVNDLLIGDKNALIIGARISGFGEGYNVTVECRDCATKNDEIFNLKEAQIKEFDPDTKFSDQGTFFIKLPQTEVEVECKLLTAADEHHLLGLADKKRKLNLPDAIITDQCKSFIVSLNGVIERSVVDEFVESMPARDANYLRKEYEKVRPDVDTSYSFECNLCGAENDIELPFTTTFFWPK